MTLSAIIIAKNEGKNISSCIKSLNFCDEILVIDNDSKDQTTNIALSLGAKIYKIHGLDFAHLRNAGKENAHGQWLLYIDADENISPGLAKEIVRKIKDKDNIYTSFSIIRENYYLGKKWPGQEHIVRLMKKDSLLGWQGVLHESPQTTGNQGKLYSSIIHHTHESISSMVEKTNEWSDIESLLRYKSNHPKVVWWRFFRVMITAFYKSYIKEKGWKAKQTGLIESLYQSFSIFITYAKLWEMQNGNIDHE